MAQVFRDSVHEPADFAGVHSNSDSSPKLLAAAHSTRAKTKVVDASPKLPVDPIYGEDAVARFVLDNFPKKPAKTQTNSSNSQREGNPELGIYVNLSANRGLLNSSLRENQELLRLQAFTKDKPVKIVAQVVMNRDESLNHLTATLADRIISNMGAPPADLKELEVVRYEISNGSKRLLFAGQSKGMTADLSDLLTSDPEAMKAQKIMLFNRAHGEAMHGLMGDAGTTSVDALNATLRNALTDSGHEKFDLLDLDSCLMGNAQVLSQLEPNAKYVIASEEPEVAIAPIAGDEHKVPISNAQPISEEVRRLLKNPARDLDLAAQDVFTANGDQCEKYSPDGLCGANTLGLYNEGHAKEFSQALDHFGEVLSAAARTSDNMLGLQMAVASTPQIEGEADKYDNVIKRADLGSFVSKVRAEMKTGRIVDTADGAIEKSAIQLQGAMSLMVAENFNSYRPKLQKVFENVHLPTAQLSGVSTFLPARQTNNMLRAYHKQFQDESIPSQPHWNQFVNDIAEPLDKVDHAPPSPNEHAALDQSERRPKLPE